jgi:hypothetical protein
MTGSSPPQNRENTKSKRPPNKAPGATSGAGFANKANQKIPFEQKEPDYLLLWGCFFRSGFGGNHFLSS